MSNTSTPLARGTPTSPHPPGSSSTSTSQGESTVNRACESCRLLKVRCLPSVSGAKCQRCAKTGRPCHYAAPQKRRPRKRTDTRVAELEREVRAMRALLGRKVKESERGKGKDGRDGGDGRDGNDRNKGPERDGETGRELEDLEEESERASPETYNDADGEGEGENGGPPDDVYNFPGLKAAMVESTATVLKSNEPGMFSITDWNDNKGTDESAKETSRSPDPIDREIISMERATELFEIYNKHHLISAPLVAFSADQTAEEVRRTRPVLFLSIITAVAGKSDSELYSRLHDELLHIFAERFIINTEKSLELVQSFLITAVWLYPPDDFRRLKFYQYIHMAAALCLDLGIGNMFGARNCTMNWSKAHFTEGDNKYFGQDPESVPDFTGDSEEVVDDVWMIESRRTYLACYLMCSNVAMSLRRPNMFQWSNFARDCLQYLQKSPQALPSDKHLIAWVKMQNIAEECGTSFSFDDPTMRVNMSDPRMQVTLKGFEKRMGDWKNSVDPIVLTPNLEMHYYQNRIFLQESAILIRDLDEPPPQPWTAQFTYSKPLSAASGNAIMTVIESAHALLDAFLRLDKDGMTSLPVINFVRMAYAVVLLIKLSAAASSPTSTVHSILEPSTLKVDFYLSRLTSSLKSTLLPNKYRVPTKFLQILLKLGLWYRTHRTRTLKIGLGHGVLIQPMMNMVANDVPGPEVGDIRAAGDIRVYEGSAEEFMRGVPMAGQTESGPQNFPFRYMNSIGGAALASKSPARAPSLPSASKQASRTKSQSQRQQQPLPSQPHPHPQPPQIPSHLSGLQQQQQQQQPDLLTAGSWIPNPDIPFDDFNMDPMDMDMMNLGDEMQFGLGSGDLTGWLPEEENGAIGRWEDIMQGNVVAGVGAVPGVGDGSWNWGEGL